MLFQLLLCKGNKAVMIYNSHRTLTPPFPRTHNNSRACFLLTRLQSLSRKKKKKHNPPLPFQFPDSPTRRYRERHGRYLRYVSIRGRVWGDATRSETVISNLTGAFREGKESWAGDGISGNRSNPAFDRGTANSGSVCQVLLSTSPHRSRRRPVPDFIALWAMCRGTRVH